MSNISSDNKHEVQYISFNNKTNDETILSEAPIVTLFNSAKKKEDNTSSTSLSFNKSSSFLKTLNGNDNSSSTIGSVLSNEIHMEEIIKVGFIDNNKFKNKKTFLSFETDYDRDHDREINYNRLNEYNSIKKTKTLTNNPFFRECTS